MRLMSAASELLRRPFATANREALGFVVMFYGGIVVVLALVGLAVWLVVG